MKLSRNLVRLLRPLAFISSTKVRSRRLSRRILTGPDLVPTWASSWAPTCVVTCAVWPTRTRNVTEELDKKFDDGEDIDEYIDWSKARRPGLEARRVNVDFPAWVVAALDREAQRLGVTRQSVIKVWIAERLEATRPG